MAQTETLATMASPARQGFNPYIQGLRGGAALLVFFYHTFLAAEKVGIYPEAWRGLPAQLFDAGRFGVELFFMISGYLISETLARKHSVRQFFIDRALRIYPAFIGVMIPVTCAGLVLRNEMFATTPPWSWPLHMLSNLLFLPGVFELPILLTVAWSLSFELAFYLTAAGAYALHRRGQRAAAIALCAAVGLILFARSPSVLYFFAGTAIYLGRDALVRCTRWAPPSLSLLTMLVLWQIVMLNYAIPHAPLNAGFAVLIVAAVLAGLLFFDAVVHGRGALVQGLKLKPMQFAGTISYSFYLWHAVVMFPLKRLLVPPLVSLCGPSWTLLIFMLVSLSIATLIAWLSYQLLETGLRNWLARRLLVSPVVNPPLNPMA